MRSFRAGRWAFELSYDADAEGRLLSSKKLFVYVEDSVLLEVQEMSNARDDSEFTLWDLGAREFRVFQVKDSVIFPVDHQRAGLYVL
jgi:hypothetical protein